MRDTFGRGYMETELEKLGKEIETELDLYLIGGGAMSFLNLKDATKDIDVVVSNASDLSDLEDALRERGYESVKELDTE
jgi:hypothetical protein